MNTETQQMLAALGALADDLTGKLRQIDTKVNSLIPSVSGTLVKSIYVDPNNGDDAAPGSNADPVQSLAGAAAMTSNAGIYHVFLKDDVILDQRVTFRGSDVFFLSDVLYEKRRIDWANQIDGVTTLSPALRSGMRFCSFTFRDIIFGNTVMAPHVVTKRMIEGEGFMNVNTWICEWDTQAGDELRFVETNGQLALWILSGVVPAEQAGLWVNNNSAGTDPATVPHIINTNLASL